MNYRRVVTRGGILDRLVLRRNSDVVPRENTAISNAISHDCREQHRLALSTRCRRRRRRLAAERVVGPETSWQTFRNGILPRGAPAYLPFVASFSFPPSFLPCLRPLWRVYLQKIPY